MIKIPKWGYQISITTMFHNNYKIPNALKKLLTHEQTCCQFGLGFAGQFFGLLQAHSQVWWLAGCPRSRMALAGRLEQFYPSPCEYHPPAEQPRRVLMAMAKGKSKPTFTSLFYASACISLANISLANSGNMTRCRVRMDMHSKNTVDSEM